MKPQLDTQTRIAKPGEDIAQLRDLPTLPEVAQHLALLTLQGERGKGDLYRTVLFDPPLAARIMQVAISAGSSVFTLGAAMKSLSTHTLFQLCNHASLLKTFDPYAPLGITSASVWRHSVLTGLLTRNLQVRKRLHEGDRVDVYLAGLLHNIGWIVLDATMPSGVRRAAKRRAASGGWSLEMEREIFGITHTEAGALLLQGWKLPEAVVQAVLHHHEPEKAGKHDWLAGLVGIAAAMNEEVFPLEPEFGRLPRSIPHRLEHTGGRLAIAEMKQRYATAINRAKQSVNSMLDWLTPDAIPTHF